jgi:hypothetical protein
VDTFGKIVYLALEKARVGVTITFLSPGLFRSFFPCDDGCVLVRRHEGGFGTAMDVGFVRRRESLSQDSRLYSRSVGPINRE